MSNFLNLTVRGVPVIPGLDRPYVGQVFFVCNRTGGGGANGNDGLSPLTPLSTLAAAIAKCNAAPDDSPYATNDDVIFVLPGHAETLASAGAIACNKAGVSIIGLGNGNSRPTFTWSATASTWTITAANVTIKNIRTTSSIAGMVKLFSITAAGATLDTVDYYEDGTTDALQFVLTTAAAVDMTIKNCTWYRGTTAASALSQWIVLTGADRAKIVNNFLINKGFATANPINSAVAVVGTLCLGIQIIGNRFYDSNSTGNIPILMIANTTGVIQDNRGGTSKTATVGAVAPGSCFAAENYFSNEVAKSGFLDPAADTT